MLIKVTLEILIPPKNYYSQQNEKYIKIQANKQQLCSKFNIKLTPLIK